MGVAIIRRLPSGVDSDTFATELLGPGFQYLDSSGASATHAIQSDGGWDTQSAMTAFCYFSQRMTEKLH